MLTQTKTETLAINDIVQLGNGHKLIITEIKFSRPANPYLGVLVNGQGKEYKFGYKHRPIKIGVADKNHPALRAMAARKSRVPGVGIDLTAVRQLVEAVLSDDTVAAKVLAKVVQAQVSP